MLFTAIATIALGVLPLTTALPTDTPATSSAQASAHNIYLVTCVPRTRNNDDDRPPVAAQNFTAVAYFRKPIKDADRDPDSGTPRPNKAALISQPPEAWDGVKWKAKVWRDKVFSADIAPGAKSLTKGAIAGSVKLDDEEYVCFKDGETAIRVREDGLRGKCVADYWCAGLDDGRNDDGM